MCLSAMALISVTSTQLRAVTNMATPLELVNYGGTFPHLLLFQSKPPGYPCHGFPAGHASGGFALICLYWAWLNQALSIEEDYSLDSALEV
jgi:membrane-associated PAP2 superfamily phosphatase